VCQCDTQQAAEHLRTVTACTCRGWVNSFNSDTPATTSYDLLVGSGNKCQGKGTKVGTEWATSGCQQHTALYDCGSYTSKKLFFNWIM
jgi:hypothetical protein